MSRKWQTEYDIAKYYYYLGLIIGIPVYIFFTLYMLEINNNAKNVGSIIASFIIFPIILLPFLVSEVVFFFMWFPYERKRKKAFQLGEEYEARIIGINRRTKGKLRIIVKSSYYTLDVQYKKGRRKQTFTTDVYIYAPRGYIPRNRKCKVYEYNGKAYIQDFYYSKPVNSEHSIEELIDKFEAEGRMHNADSLIRLSNSEKGDEEHWNNASDLREHFVEMDNLYEFSNDEIPCLNDEEFQLALQEREEYPPRKSNWHILMPAILIIKDSEQAYVFVELSVTSVNTISYEDLNIYKMLCTYVRDNNKYFEGNVAGYIYDIKNYVIDSCKETIPKLKINEVLVSIRDL